MSAAEPLLAQDADEQGAVKELRLAVVCYGGVSLAIYMHGQTKEISRLVAASRLLEDGTTGRAISGSEGVYVALLRELADQHPERVRTRVVVDTVAGTSAGGINGVYLAKAIAHNRSQDELRNLWLEKGDIGGLIRGPKRIPWKVRAAIRGLLFRRGAPLHGDLMSVWIYEALDAMDKQARTPGEPATLMPELQTLQLFVTMTDFYGYNRDVVLADPDPVPSRPIQPISDWRHRHVLEFRYGPDRDDFGVADNAALAFSARTTASFPGAFPPVSFDDFEGYLRKLRVRFPPELDEKYFRQYGLSSAVPRNAFFIDGGVLDNRPFGHAIAAIRGKHAVTEVDRRLVYLEPDPGAPGPPLKREAPSTIATVLGAVSGIPRKEPLLEDLLEVVRLNDRVRRVRDVIETSFDRIGERVQELIGQPLEELPPGLGTDAVASWSKSIHAAAQNDSGFGYATYIRLKISAVVDRYARAVCAASNFPDDCNQAFFVRAVMRSWAESAGLFEKEGSPTAAQETFLREFDLEFRKRRLQFAISGLNWFYRDRAQGKPGYPPRDELDEVKTRLYAAVRGLDQALDAIRDDETLSSGVAGRFSSEAIAESIKQEGFNPAQFAATHKPELDRLREQLSAHLQPALADLASRLYADLDRLTASWRPERRRDLLVRYLGFPFWDVLLYPLQTLADAGERDHVQVLRLSPQDPKLLGKQGESKLVGVGLHHFGAFFSRQGRENDYLWGRLDAAEQLIQLLLPHDDPHFTKWCKRAFEAILSEESSTSPPLSDDVLDELRTRVAALPG